MLGVIPDTQTYADHAPETFVAELDWFREAVEDGIPLRALVHEGDVVEHNSPGEWATARRAFDALEGSVPFAIALGNHDLGEGGSASDRTSRFGEFFDENDFAMLDRSQSHIPRHEENSVHLFTPYEGSEPWMILVLEFAPRASVLDWAEGGLEANRDRRTILVTHTYLYFDGRRYSDEAAEHQAWDVREYAVGRDPGDHAAQGEEIFRRLVHPHGQIELVLCGHVLETGIAQQTSPQADGGFVHEILANYQHTDDMLQGIVRLIEVDDAARLFRVRTVGLATGVRAPGPHSFDLAMDLRSAHEDHIAEGTRPGR